MISLRGVIQHASVPKNSTDTKPNQAPPSASSSGSPLFDPLTTRPGEWVWTGHWSFGSLPPEDVIDPSAVYSGQSPPSASPPGGVSGVVGSKRRGGGRKRPLLGVRPFMYKFEKIVDAKNVMVPSSLIGESEDDDGEEDIESQQENTHGDGPNTGADKAEASNSLNDDEDDDDNDTRLQSPKKREDDVQQCDVQNQVSNQTAESLPAKQRIKNLDVDLENTSEDIATEKGDDEKKQKINQDKEISTTIEEFPMKDHSASKRAESDSKQFSDAKEHDEKQGTEEVKDENLHDESFKTDKIMSGSSFAEVEGGVFTDAARASYPDTCPIGGCWKGYFENISLQKRKDRLTSRVQETFHLFFNATPPPGARMAFELDENDDSSDVRNPNEGVLPKGYIHVRGAGNNQFGTFEIIGGFNVETGVLSCQRIYVTTTDGIGSKPEKDKHRDKTKVATTTTPMRKSYFTRKRPYRRPGYGSDDGRKKGVRGRKKRRIAPEETPNIDGETPVEEERTNHVPEISSSSQASLPTDENPPLRVQVPVATGKTQTMKRPSPTTKGVQSRKSKLAQQPNRKSIKGINSYHIDMPKTGNPDDARWRSAHFLYYLRHADDVSSSVSPNSSSPTLIAPSKTSYIVYEGEMNIGNNIRDGKGVCLYNNNMIYEGEWRNNKEHGHGSLFNGDRSQTIYVGDWEKGKMHGNGTYYYHAIGCEGKLEVGGSYTGEFKENTRHGVGKYSFNNGYSYEGEWRDNVPCGRGVFRWPDGSEYIGHWKDGRRHGMGKLIVSDGFVYDGMWVENAMEGKGKAVYPNGQQYDGMWLNGKRDGRGTLIFGNGAVYKGRFKEDCLEGQGTLKLDRNVSIPALCDSTEQDSKPDEVMNTKHDAISENEGENRTDTDKMVEKRDWMIPIEFQSDIGHIHQKAGFTTGGE